MGVSQENRTEGLLIWTQVTVKGVSQQLAPQMNRVSRGRQYVQRRSVKKQKTRRINRLLKTRVVRYQNNVFAHRILSQGRQNEKSLMRPFQYYHYKSCGVKV